MRRILGTVLCGAMGLLGLQGCILQQPNPDINRVHKPYLPKGWFSDGQSWYLRRTITDAPAQSWFAIGDGDWPNVQRLRFEIRENALILYRDYELVPGSETAEQPGADYLGVPIAQFPIKEHFDIRRQYNPLTGEATNVVEKNAEAPWYEREYFDVDWGAPYATGDSSGWGWLGVSVLKGLESAFYVQEQESSNPDRARFSSDYLEFTRRESVGPDIYACLGGLGYGKVPDCGAGIVDVRWSFERVGEHDDEFEPTPFPDSVTLVDEHGDQVQEGGRAVKVPIFDKFGFFRLERLAYDRDRGVTDSGRIMRAFKFNIWQRVKDNAGNNIPFPDRQPRPIVYYENAEVPEDEWSANSDRLANLTIHQANVEIARGYDKIFRETVETLQGKALPADFKMFEIRQNDCRFSNVTDFADKHGFKASLDDVGGFDGFVTQHNAVGEACRADPMGRTCSTLRQKWAYTLKQGCTLLESATENAGNGQPKFTWQRLGDVRYSFVHLTSHAQSVGWLGLGMLAGDPITAEIRNAFAYVDGPGTDYSAAQALDMVDAMNDQTLMTDLVFGTDISRYTEAQNAKVGAKLRGYPTEETIQGINRRFRSAGRSTEELLREGDSLSTAKARLAAIKGTPAELALVNQDDMLLAAAGPVGEAAQWSEELLDRASPARGGVLNLREMARARDARAMGVAGQSGYDGPGPCHYMAEFLDDGVIGLALEIRDWEKVERWAYLRKAIYETVMLHEVGHTLGLRHNFQGTWDALNFHDQFWDRLKSYTSIQDGERTPLALEDAVAAAEGLIAGASDDEKPGYEADLAMLNDCMAKADDGRNRFIRECVANNTGGGTEAAKISACRGQVPSAEAAGEILVLNAMQCLRAEEGKSSSVMDYHGKLNGRFAGLGHYDSAAIKFGYGQIVEEFEEDALKNIGVNSAPDAIKTWLFDHDYKRIPDDLADGPEGIRRRVNRYRPWKATTTTWRPTPVEVPFGFCSDEYAYYGFGGTDVCRLRDHGANHREQMEHDILRYKQYYFFSNFARNRLSWDIGAAINSNATVFNNILNTFQYMYLYRAFDPAFFDKDSGKDFLQASIAGLDLYSEVLAQPEMGTFVSPNSSWGFTRNSMVRGRWLRVSAQENLDLPLGQMRGAAEGRTGLALPTYWFHKCEFGDSDTYDCNLPGGNYPGFICSGNLCGIDVPLGDGRPSYLNFTADYEDWFFTYVGNYFDKENILVNLVFSQAYFPRLSSESIGAGSDNPNLRLLNVGLSNLFGDSIRKMLYGVITDRPTEYASLYRPRTGQYLPRSFNILNEEAQMEDTDILVMPRRISNIPYVAMLYAAAFQSSLNDGVLDFLSVIQVGVKGEEDDIQSWDNLPADQRAEFTHPQTGVTYRAAKVGDRPVAFDLVNEAIRYGARWSGYQECVDQPAKADGVCACTYVGAFNAIDKDNDGEIHGTGDMNNPADECVLMKPENGLNVCESRVEPCETADRVDMRDRALERMEAVVERLENVRSFYQSFQGSFRL